MPSRQIIYRDNTSRSTDRRSFRSNFFTAQLGYDPDFTSSEVRSRIFALATESQINLIEFISCITPGWKLEFLYEILMICNVEALPYFDRRFVEELRSIPDPRPTLTLRLIPMVWDQFDPGDLSDVFNSYFNFAAGIEFPGTNIQNALEDVSRNWQIQFVSDTDEMNLFEKEESENSKIEELTHAMETEMHEVVLERIGFMRDIIPYLQPGMLGLHRVDNKPFNLILRLNPASDPKASRIVKNGWFELRDNPGIVYAPATVENFNKLKSSGLRFEPTPKVRNWVSGESDDIVFPEECPLFPYQKEAVKFISSKDRAMLSLSPGLGKTITAAYAASIRRWKYVLLVAPASLLYYWKTELSKWNDRMPGNRIAQVWHRTTGTRPIPEAEEDQVWVITNPETLSKRSEFKTLPWDALIVDESIMYKHRNSGRSKAIFEMSKRIENVWLLTGAPATRNLDDMWHQFHILNPRGYASYWRFAKNYCIVEENNWGSKVVSNKVDAEKRIKENFSDVFFARSQEEVLNIPDWVFENVDIPMLPAQQKVYDKLQEELRIEIGEAPDEEVLTAANRLSMLIRSLQVCSNPVLVGSTNSSGKWSALLDLMDFYPGPYIVWVNFRRTGEMIQELLKSSSHRVSLVNGSTPMEDRNKIVQEFQEGVHNVIIMNNSVGKFGFNLTKARTAFFLERAYDDSYFQCLHRFRRIGTTLSPIVVNMRSLTKNGNLTIDHAIHDVLDYRNNMIRELTIGALKKVVNNV